METKVKCSACGKEFLANEVSKGKNVNYICKSCKRKRIIIWCSVIAVLLAICIGVYYYVSTRPIEGNDQSLLIEAPNVDVHALPEFNLSETTPIASTTVGKTIDNLQSFKALMEQNVATAKEVNSSSLEIPNIASLFEFNSAELSITDKELILEFISVYKQTNQQSKIFINGYACNIGSNNANNRISEARAKAVSEFIVKNGIFEENLIVNWFGKTQNSTFNYPEMKDYRRVIIGIK